MRILVGYGTTEGHTRKVARHVADHLFGRGHTVELLHLKDAGAPALERFDGCILAGSVHGSRYQPSLTEFAANHAETLAGMRTLLLSVSLSAAGHDADDWKGLERIVAEFEEATGWSPGAVEQIAGAYAPEAYDVFRRFIMRRIIASRNPDADPEAAKDYTDWPALDAALDRWAAQ